MDAVPAPRVDPTPPAGSASTYFDPTPCVHLGERIPGRPCGSTLHRCGYDGATCSRFVKCTGADRVCSQCPHRKTDESGAAARKPFAGPRRVVVPAPPDLKLAPRRRRAVVTVAVGDEGRDLFSATAGHMKAYADRLEADFVVLDWPGHPTWPMSAKFALGRVLDYYDRIAYVDADVLLRPGCVDLFDMCAPDEMGVVDELPYHRMSPQFGREAGYHKFREKMKLQPIKYLPWYFNAGVVVVPRSHKELLLPPPNPIPVSHCGEQDHTNSRLYDTGMKYRLMDRRANWQIWTDHEFRSAPPDAILHWSGAGSARSGRVTSIRHWALRFPVERQADTR